MLALQQKIILLADADKDAGAAGAQALGIAGGVLKSFPGDLQQQPMLRIEPACFAVRNAEEVSVKPLHIGQQGGLRAPAGQQNPALEGNIHHRVSARAQQMPEFFDVGGTREAAAHPDYGQFLSIAPIGLRLDQAAFQMLDREQGLAHRIQGLPPACPKSPDTLI